MSQRQLIVKKLSQLALWGSWVTGALPSPCRQLLPRASFTNLVHCLYEFGDRSQKSYESCAFLSFLSLLHLLSFYVLWSFLFLSEGMFLFRENRFIIDQHFLQLLPHFFPLLWYFLSLGRWIILNVWLFYSIDSWTLRHYTTTTMASSQQLDQLWVSTLTNTYCENISIHDWC